MYNELNNTRAACDQLSREKVKSYKNVITDVFSVLRVDFQAVQKHDDYLPPKKYIGINYNNFHISIKKFTI